MERLAGPRSGTRSRSTHTTRTIHRPTILSTSAGITRRSTHEIVGWGPQREIAITIAETFIESTSDIVYRTIKRAALIRNPSMTATGTKVGVSVSSVIQTFGALW